MFKINIVGEIGWDVYSFMIKDKLDEAKGKDIEVDLSSPGGSVFEGIEIFNLFRAYKRENPNAQMILNITGEAASMGSYLSANEVFDIVTVEDNATYMIHNPLMGVIGDYIEMRKGAEFLERLAIMMAPVYANRSSQQLEKVRTDMDNETWLFGQEIIDAGFADEIIKTKKSSGDSKASAIANAEIKYKTVMKKVRESEIKESDFERVAAIMTEIKPEPKKEPKSTQPAKSGKNNQEVIKLKNKDELQDEYPEIHTAVMKAGEDKGKEKIIANNKAIMEFKNKEEYKNLEFVQMRCEKAIEDGEDIADLKMSISALMLDPKNQASMESPGAINTGNPDGSVSGEVNTDIEMKAEELEKENGEW